MATSRMRLSLLVVFLLVCFPSFSQVAVDGIIYDYRNNSEVIVSRKTGGYSGNIVIPESVVMNGKTYRVVGIGFQAFQFSSIESIKIPNSVKDISSTAFQGCSRLTSVTIPNSVEKIGKDAFRECMNLESITLSNSLTSIEENTFYGCKSLKSITIPNSVTTIGDWAFWECTNLKSVTLPARLSSIKMVAFAKCSNLESVTTINSMTLDFTAFLGCDKLKEIVLGKDVANIEINGNNIIYNKVVCLSDNPPQVGWFSSDKKVIINELEVPYGHTLDYVNAERLKDIAPVIYSSNNGSRHYPVSIIAEGDRVVTVNGNYYVAEVKDGEKAVVRCNTNTASHSLIMKMTQNLTPFLSDKGTFSFIPSKRHSENVICTYAFPLTDVTLSESGTLMDRIDINNISSIENLKITGNINGTDLLVIRKMENLKLLDLKDAHIVDGGMSYYDNYTTSKNKIGKYFFYNNKKLYTVLLPQDITEICDYALGSSKLRTISIPKSVNTMWSPFLSYSGLASIYIEDLAGFCTMKHIGNTWGYHSPYKEDDKHDLYLNGNELVDLVIPEGVKEISDYAFCYCRGFDSVVIPSSVTKIGKEAFNCRIKDYIRCLNQTPPEITNNTFVGVQDITLYVPKGSRMSYWLQPYWENFKNIIEMDGTGIDNIDPDPPTDTPGQEDTPNPESEIKAIKLEFDGTSMTIQLSQQPKIVMGNGCVVIKTNNKSTFVSLPCRVTFVDATGTTAIDDVVIRNNDETKPFSVFTLDGRKVGTLKDRKETLSLKRGVYIINGKKIFIK